jgi:hypothetical protein
MRLTIRLQLISKFRMSAPLPPSLEPSYSTVAVFHKGKKTFKTVLFLPILPVKRFLLPLLVRRTHSETLQSHLGHLNE